MKFIGKDKKLLSPIQQLALGAELGRVSLELVDKNIETASFIKSEFGKSEAGKTPTKKDKSSKDAKPKKASEAQEIMLEPKIQLAIDKKFYYRISAKDKQVRVLCMAFDACSEFFELVSSEPAPIMERLAKENRFDDYEMDILHRIDIGTQIGRAYVAAKLDYSFVQDLSLVFKINHDHLPFLIADGDSFLDVHKKVLLRIYTEGLTENHGDSWKGLARTAAVLAIYRDADKALSKLPEIYRQGSEDTATMRQEYKKELLRKDHDGTYTYGERTREYFSFDQLDRTIDTLRKNPDSASVIQRFDPSKDMSSYVEEETRKVKYTHDPCLTHDIFFIQDGKLHSFHIARAHNIVNAYPENIFGLHDAYVETVCKGLGLKGGDMYMLSNRANILLITEEQRTKKLLNEPSKPVGEVDTSSGPYLLDKKTKLPKKETGIAFFTMKARANSKKPADPILKKLENYKGQNILQKAVEYLKVRGGMHNNPIVTEYYAGIDDPQKDQLVFFQANVYGNKVYGTAVFANRSLKKKDSDTKLCNYIMTQFSKRLNVPLGELNVIYVRFKK